MEPIKSEVTEEGIKRGDAALLKMLRTPPQPKIRVRPEPKRS